MRKKSKLVYILTTIVLICMLFSLISCNRSYVEEEVLRAGEELIRRSERVNAIFYGRGIAYSPDVSLAEGYYYMAETLSLREFGVETVADMEKLVTDTYTHSMSNLIISTKLRSISDEDGIKTYARYHQKYSDIDKTVPEYIMVYKDAEVFLRDSIIYHYQSLRVSHVKRESIFLNIDVTVINSEGDMQDKTLEIELIEEESGFRLNTPTYTRYIDNTYYNELQNKK